MLPWILCAVLLFIIILLIGKTVFLQKAMDEIGVLFRECLSTDTNTLLTVSSGDRHVRKLADEINKELRILRGQRRKYLNGDRELKEAVTNISHDLRTPLTAISGYLELLEKEEKSANVERYLSFIENRTGALKQLTEEMFRFTVILSNEQPVSGPVDIRAVLEESVLEFYGALTERGILPEIQLPENSVIRQVDPKALSRIFGNILDNALKYSEGDLKILLQEDGKVIFSNKAPALDEVQVGKLFNRFYTVEAAHYSTGLGLSIAKTLAARMKGNLTARYQDSELHIILEFPQWQNRYGILRKRSG